MEALAPEPWLLEECTPEVPALERSALPLLASQALEVLIWLPQYAEDSCMQAAKQAALENLGETSAVLSQAETAKRKLPKKTLLFKGKTSVDVARALETSLAAFNSAS